MKTIAPLTDEDVDRAPPFRKLSAQEAKLLRERNPQIKLWKVLAGQVVVGALVAVAAWGWTGKLEAGVSAAYGALAVVIPAAIFARGLTGRFASLNAGSAAVAFMVWEMVKLLLTVAMLVMAPKVVVGLSWPALLAGLILTVKIYWVVMLAPAKRAAPSETRVS
ncbi:ATP synthase subunit I [Caenimonas koreensis DSM 17982]|uniref:ATP synthase subunit I n=1 Tax=Caenimonas koreensis DSM 17982 TaxID=1121255 RepID=A0A844B7A7_9BURK|nr:ATP synthase subunit I [Caenimonas koreensis]MRD49053.1 ATP synthase subunit I [Caenimonas koreensis DSM 17982]